MTPYQTSLAIAGAVHLFETLGTLLLETLIAKGKPNSDNVEAILSMQLVGGAVSAPINALAMTMAISLTEQATHPCSSLLTWSFVGAGGLASVFFQASLGKIILDALGRALHTSLLKDYSPPFFLSEQEGLLLIDGLGLLGAILLFAIAYLTYSALNHLYKSSQPEPVEVQATLVINPMANTVDLGILAVGNAPPNDNMPTVYAVQTGLPAQPVINGVIYFQQQVV